MNKQKNVVPEWFQYDAAGELDADATLAAVPCALDAECVFFRDVPEWYEVTDLSEVDETIEELKKATPEAPSDMTAEDAARMLENFTRMRSYIALYNRPKLSLIQKKLMRAICYWASVKTMAEIPQDDEE